MVWVILKEQLNWLLASLYTEGVLDLEFNQLQRLQDDDNPGFNVDVFTEFCRESDRIFREIDRLLEKPVMDYPGIIAHIHKLKGSCASVGGRLVKFYCQELHSSYEKNDTAEIMRALNRIKQESVSLRINFQKDIETERKILADSSTA